MKVSTSKSTCIVPLSSHDRIPYSVPSRTQSLPLTSADYYTQTPSRPTSDIKINETASGVMMGIVFGAGIVVAAALVATGNIGPCGSPTLVSQCGAIEALR